MLALTHKHGRGCKHRSAYAELVEVMRCFGFAEGAFEFVMW